jgi:hypothetical protein
MSLPNKFYFNRCGAKYIDENIEENYTFGLLLPSGVRSMDFLDLLDVNFDYEEIKENHTPE